MADKIKHFLHDGISKLHHLGFKTTGINGLKGDGILIEDIQAVFIDRDGTIGGNGHFIHPRDFTLYPFAQEAINRLKQTGIYVFAITNQHRIAKGQATEEEFLEQFHSYGFDEAFICPHNPEENCKCHKPAPGLLHKAASKYNLDLKKCAVIGDVGSTDMLAAEAVGAIKILVRTGWGEQSLGEFKEEWANCTPDYIGGNLLNAVQWLESTYSFNAKEI